MDDENNFDESVEFVESYAILMIGTIQTAIPSILHLQKELFILSKVKPEIQKHFDFRAHYKGPFSQILNNVIEDPTFTKNAFDIKENKIVLDKNGLKEFKKIVEEYKENQKLKDTLLQMNFIRKLYDGLSTNELLFLIYDTYKEFPERSLVSDKILKNLFLTNNIIENLFKKSYITYDKFFELKRKYV
jgi:hypothetical protein